MKKKLVTEYISLDIRKIPVVFKPDTWSTKVSWTAQHPFGEEDTFTSNLFYNENVLHLTNPFDEEQIPVNILLRKVHFGWRKCFQCPFCGRRCEIIYFSTDDYGCRKCLELVYPFMQESRKPDKLVQYLFPGLPPKLAKRAFAKIMEKFKKPLF